MLFWQVKDNECFIEGNIPSLGQPVALGVVLEGILS